MLRLGCIFFLLLFFFSFQVTAQKDSITTLSKKEKRRLNKALQQDYNPLSPSKAAFYSAVFPGGGQIYNKKYWKAPIVWGALGTSIYFYLDNNKEYIRYRTAFKQREAGLQDEFTLDDGTVLISRNGLVNAQRVLRNNRDLSLLTTVLLYVLQVVEASVNAHLIQFNTNDNLTFKPTVIRNGMRFDSQSVGFKISYTF